MGGGVASKLKDLGEDAEALAGSDLIGPTSNAT